MDIQCTEVEITDSPPTVDNILDSPFNGLSIEFKCQVCSKVFESDKAFNLHDCAKNFQCLTCHKFFLTRSAEISHSKTHLYAKNKKNSLQQAFKSNFSSQLESTQIYKKSSVSPETPSHMLSFISSAQTKKGQYSKTGKSIKKKINETFPNYSQCSFCPMFFPTNEKLTSHAIAVHNKKLYACLHCEEKFLHKELLQSHIKFNCQFKSNAEEHKIESHAKHTNYLIEKVPNILNNTKKEDNGSFSIPEIIINPVTGNKLYKCDICNTLLTTVANVARHKRTVHKMSSPLLCQICEKTFHCKFALAHHLARHAAKNSKNKSRNQNNNSLIQRYSPNYLSDDFLQDDETKSGNNPIIRNSIGFLTNGNFIQDDEPRNDNTSDHQMTFGSYMKEDINDSFTIECSSVSMQVPPSASSPLTQNNEDMDMWCFECDITFASQGEFAGHYIRKHTDVKSPYICPFCQKKITRKNRLKMHLTQQHAVDKSYLVISKNNFNSTIEPINFSCNICQAPFPFRNSLKRHLRYKHTNCFKCYFCKLVAYLTIEEVTNHALTHRQHPHIGKPGVNIETLSACLLKLNECVFCSSTFSNLVELGIHLRNHAPYDPMITCHICNDTFALYLSFEKHMNKHNNNISNNNISRKKVQKSQLQSKSVLKKLKHSLTVKPKLLPNPEITKVSSKKIRLNLPLKCHICPTTLARPSTLFRHINEIHHDSQGQPNCHICSKKFQTVYSLKKHLIRHSCKGYIDQELRSKNISPEKVSNNKIKLASSDSPSDSAPSKITLYRCYICNSICRDPLTLSEHISSHSIINTNLSDNKLTNSKNSKKSSNQLIFYKCLMCPAYFLTTHSLRDHQNIHFGRL